MLPFIILQELLRELQAAGLNQIIHFIYKYGCVVCLRKLEKVDHVAALLFKQKLIDQHTLLAEILDEDNAPQLNLDENGHFEILYQMIMIIHGYPTEFYDKYFKTDILGAGMAILRNKDPHHFSVIGQKLNSMIQLPSFCLDMLAKKMRRNRKKLYSQCSRCDTFCIDDMFNWHCVLHVFLIHISSSAHSRPNYMKIMYGSEKWYDIV
uniref:Uncharacterized protein n=1 Tax=Ditylenchus dipsaci TaxID=166011 RepID=A0A915CZW1_9BILA